VKFRDMIGKALSATPQGLLTINGRVGGTLPGPSLEGAFAGSSMFGYPRSSYVDGYFFTMQNASYAYIWQHQEMVSSVVDYLALQFAQVTPRLHALDLETGALGNEDFSHPAAQSTRHPADHYEGAEWREKMALDRLVFGNAYSVIVKPPGAERATLLHIPAYAMGVRGANKIVPDAYRIIYATGEYKDLTPDEVIHWRGPNAIDPRTGWAPMEQLRQILIDEATRQATSIEFNRGGRIKGGFVKRPMDAPKWSDAARIRFEERFAGMLKGLHTGRSITLEEGMEWVDAGITPSEAQVLQASQLSFQQVCRAYGLHPALFGGVDGATIAVLPEARKMLYADVLAGHFIRFADVLNLKVARGIYGADNRVFVFDWNAKLEGEEDRLQKLTGAAGRPPYTVNEVRALLGKEPKPGGDDLVLPSNVAPGYQDLPPTPGNTPASKPSTNVQPIPNPTTPAQDGSHREGNPPAAKADAKALLTADLSLALAHGDLSKAASLVAALDALDSIEPPAETRTKSEDALPMGLREALTKAGRYDDIERLSADEYKLKAIVRRNAASRRKNGYADAQAALIRRHFARQEKALRGKSAARADGERWDSELAHDLLDLTKAQIETEGGIWGERFMGGFDPEQVQHFAEAEAKKAAGSINAATQRALDEARDRAKSEDADPIGDTFKTAAGSRADRIGSTRGLFVASFAATEAAKQNPGADVHHVRVKEWIGSGNPNSRHKHVAGEVTLIGQPFSNGLQYPGDPGGGEAGRADCGCSIDIY